MEPKRVSKDAPPGKATPAPQPTVQPPFDRALAAFVAALPEFDKRLLDDVRAQAKDRPRAALKHLFELFSGSDPERRAVAGRFLVTLGNSDVADNLNSLIFDGEVDAWTKVMANDVLIELGAGVDPDVFAMSVPDAAQQMEKLPTRALKLLKAGDLAGATAHARALRPVERWMILHRAVCEAKEGAVPFLRALAADGEAELIAALTCVAAERLAAGVPLLAEAAPTAGKDVQKLIKRLYFELRTDGVETPEEEKPRAAPAAAAPAAPAAEGDEAMPLYRVMLSEPTARGVCMVTVARQRPNGRLKVFSVIVDLWKRGIEQAALRAEMSKSSFDRFLQQQGASAKMKVREAPLDEARRLVARGVRVSRELGTPLPLDFGMGRAMLGGLDREIAALECVFACAQCGKALDAAAVARIRELAPYDNMQPETRCASCRG
jgi:hypothetical protein